MKRARRNKACAARDCNCWCHWHTYRGHCHVGRRCRDVTCHCNVPQPQMPSLYDLFPLVTVPRGGIRYR